MQLHVRKVLDRAKQSFIWYDDVKSKGDPKEILAKNIFHERFIDKYHAM